MCSDYLSDQWRERKTAAAATARGREEERTWYQDYNVYNKHLPYCQQLEKEAGELLSDIKKNLSVAVQRRELWPGALYWTNRLSRLVQEWREREREMKPQVVSTRV